MQDEQIKQRCIELVKVLHDPEQFNQKKLEIDQLDVDVQNKIWFEFKKLRIQHNKSSVSFSSLQWAAMRPDPCFEFLFEKEEDEPEIVYLQSAFYLVKAAIFDVKHKLISQSSDNTHFLDTYLPMLGKHIAALDALLVENYQGNEEICEEIIWRTKHIASLVLINRGQDPNQLARVISQYARDIEPLISELPMIDNKKRFAAALMSGLVAGLIGFGFFVAPGALVCGAVGAAYCLYRWRQASYTEKIADDLEFAAKNFKYTASECEEAKDSKTVNLQQDLDKTPRYIQR